MLKKTFDLSVTRFKKTALALAVSAALLTTTASASNVNAQPLQLAQANDPVVAFYQDYNNCDALVLSHFWGVSFSETKVRAGAKVLAGASGIVWNDNLIPALDRYTRSSNSLPPDDVAVCYWDLNATRYQLTYQDRETVACLWQKENHSQITEYQTKLVLGILTAYRDKKHLDTILSNAVMGYGCPGRAIRG